MADELHRRQFLAVLASLGFLPSTDAAPTHYAAHFRKPNPFDPVLAHIDAGSDKFKFEKQAQEIESRLASMLHGKPLPLSPGFRGSPSLPQRYIPIAEGVSEAQFGEDPWKPAFTHWIQSLGQIRRARFFVLPAGLIRYEIASPGAYRVGFWNQVWKDGKLESWRPLSETLVTTPAPLFDDITSHSFAGVGSFHQQLLKGNVWWRARLDAATGITVDGTNGVAVGDIDNDGWDEIYVCQTGGLPNRLYKNRGDATFEDITEKAGVGVLDNCACALFADFRNSGHQDLVVLRDTGPLYFLNRGDGVFTHQPDAFHFRTPPQGAFTGMAAADYNRDGRLDLYLCTYVYFQSEDQSRYPVPYYDARNGPPNYLFRNTGSGFEDVTAETGMNHNNDRFSFAPAWCDYDGDGWPDLYVANDFGRGNLYRNRNGLFRDEASAAGVENVAPGMSAAWFDYDGDGRPDLYVSNMWTAAGQRVVKDPAFVSGGDLDAAWHTHTKGNSLFHNTGDGRFTDTSAAEGVAMGRWAWSADGLDFDNDGSPEIFITTGMMTNASEKDLDSFFWRQVVAKSGADYENGWNAINQLIREDYSWCGHEPNVFYKRIQGKFFDFSGVSGIDFADDSRAFAATDIDGDGNLDIVLKSRLGPQIRILRNNCGSPRRSLALRLRGVESNRDAIGARIEVNGHVQYLSAGSGFLSQHSKQVHVGLGDAGQANVSITWPSGRIQQFADLRAGACYQITEGSDSIQAVPFRKRAPISSTPVQPDNRPEFGASWLLDPVPLPDTRKGPGFLLLTAGKTAAPPGLPFEVVDVTQAPPDLAAHYSIFRRYLFELRADLDLPLLLLIDERSRAHKYYAEMPAPETLRRDLETLRAGSTPELALPFPGQYYSLPRRNHLKLATALYWAGYPDQAIPYLEEVLRQSPDNWKALFALAQIHFEAERWKPAMENYRAVLRIRPTHFDALLGAGQTSAQLNDSAEAEKLLRRAMESDPKNADAADQLGLVLASQGRAAEAKELFQRAISLDREHAGAINNLGVLYVKLGQTNDAIAAFRYGIDAVPDDATLYLNLGRLYLSLGQRDKARDVMQSLLTRKPGDPVALRALKELESR
ncbi:MAG: FG-GAP-like repeat-containing protein [Bryobacteraceae bacterium]